MREEFTNPFCQFFLLTREVFTGLSFSLKSKLSKKEGVTNCRWTDPTATRTSGDLQMRARASGEMTLSCTRLFLSFIFFPFFGFSFQVTRSCYLHKRPIASGKNRDNERRNRKASVVGIANRRWTAANKVLTDINTNPMIGGAAAPRAPAISFFVLSILVFSAVYRNTLKYKVTHTSITRSQSHS
jgi:hypothetical protein